MLKERLPGRKCSINSHDRIFLRVDRDINDIQNAHNLCMVALNARMQHEANYTDEELAKRNLKDLI